ncbi:MAG: GTPase Era [Gammaproteobacteria bacterium]|nr:MAG: GTPase Era [Gammaproteobacteria bacterium]
MSEPFRCGFVTIIGRPNVGKSTLINRLVDRKISITSQRPQTTRNRLIGIKTDKRAQIVYVDTPGLHTGARNTLERVMNRAARGSLEGVDCVVLMVAARGWTAADDAVMSLARRQPCPILLVINKIDRLKRRERLLPLMQQASERMAFSEIIPVSALSGENVSELESSVLRYLPAQAPLFPRDQVTDRDDRFMAAELVREQVFRSLHQELPYAVAVGIEHFERVGKLIRIGAAIWLEKESQKGIVIGRGGERLKRIGTHARGQMEKLFDCKVHLELWVKVRTGWADSQALLRTLHYGEE